MFMVHPSYHQLETDHKNLMGWITSMANAEGHNWILWISLKNGKDSTYKVRRGVIWSFDTSFSVAKNIIALNVSPGG